LGWFDLLFVVGGFEYFFVFGMMDVVLLFLGFVVLCLDCEGYGGCE